MDVSPEKLGILHYPDPALRKKARPVETFDETLRSVADRMIGLMLEVQGVGLAAPQVGLNWQLFVAHVPRPESGDEVGQAEDGLLRFTERPIVYVNPVLSDYTREADLYEEGCLSLPDIRGDVRRPEGVTIVAQDLHGKRFSQTGAGLLARCWQHEVDHLKGVLILDRMTQMSKIRNKAAIRALEQRGTRER